MKQEAKTSNNDINENDFNNDDNNVENINLIDEKREDDYEEYNEEEENGESANSETEVKTYSNNVCMGKNPYYRMHEKKSTFEKVEDLTYHSPC